MKLSPAPGGPHRCRCRISAGLLGALALASPSAAQGPIDLTPPPPAFGGFGARLPLVPEAPDGAPAASIAEGVGSPTSAIEVKVGQGRFLTLREDLAVPGRPAPFLAVGDPNVVDFFQVGPRQLRLIGKKMGTTDLSITAGSGRTYDFEVRVVADLETLRAQLRQSFPDASLQVSQVRERVVVEGQARDATQVSRIVQMIAGYLRSTQSIQVAGQVGNLANVVQAANPDAPPPPPRPAEGGQALPPLPGAQGPASTGFTGVDTGPGAALPSAGAIAANQIATDQSPVINLIRVPTSQQVLLKVRVAELNRTAFRQIGADFLAEVPQFSTLFGSQIAGNGFTGTVGNTAFPFRTGLNTAAIPALNGARAVPAMVGIGGGAARNLALGSQATLFGTFSGGRFNTVINALRRNNILKILAEPNLIALNGFQANFLAGGEFPVPTFSGVGSGSTSGGGTSSTQFKNFGVQLAFLPLIQDDDTIRLTVDPEVSSIDYSVATTLVPGGSPVPGLSVRKSHTTVELKQGETLAIAGLMQLTLNGQSQKIPLLGDLPYIGTFFSNTTGQRIEKELVVLVTPYIIEPMAPEQVPAGPGDEVREPNDLEFFLLNRIEGRTGIDKRSTTSYDDPLHLIRHSIVEKKYLIGPSGYSR